MDINDFKTFLEVNRTRHFGRAADNLCITQSTVSARIRALENQLGGKLFVRERNNLQLTPAGERFIQHAELITSTWRRAQQELGAPGGRQETLLVGGLSSLWDIFLQGWLLDVYEKSQGLVVHAEQLSHEVLHKRVINNTLDIAFTYDAAVHALLVVTQVKTIPLVLVSTEAGKGLQGALSGQYYLVDWGSSFLTQHAGLSQDAAQPSMYFGDAHIALQFLLRAGGSAYLALPQVEGHLDRERLFRVEGAPVYERSAYALTNRESERAGLMQPLLDAFAIPIRGDF